MDSAAYRTGAPRNQRPQDLAGGQECPSIGWDCNGSSTDCEMGYAGNLPEIIIAEDDVLSAAEGGLHITYETNLKCKFLIKVHPVTLHTGCFNQK